MEQPENTEKPEETPEVSDPTVPQDQAGDPLNASGDYYFKRFGSDTQLGDDPLESEPDLDDVAAASSAAEPPEEKPARAALTITIHSWATPLVGLIMLVLGVAGGYFLRPLIDPGGSPPAPTGTQAASSGTQTQSSPEDREALMAALVPNVRHFQGDPDAPITLIEFSDFQ